MAALLVVRRCRAGGSAPGAGKAGLIRCRRGRVIVHKGDLGRQAGLEVGQGAAQDAISQRRAGQLAGEDGPLHLEALAGIGHGGRTGPPGQPSADLQPQRATLGDLISEVAAAEPD
jgi:hypothetical protein